MNSSVITNNMTTDKMRFTSGYAVGNGVNQTAPKAASPNHPNASACCDISALSVHTSHAVALTISEPQNDTDNSEMPLCLTPWNRPRNIITNS